MPGEDSKYYYILKDKDDSAPLATTDEMARKSESESEEDKNARIARETGIMGEEQ